MNGGFAKCMFASPLHQIQSHYLRHLTGLPKHTPIPILIHETGSMPAACQWAKLCVRFWNKLVRLNSTEFPKAALLENLQLSKEGRNGKRQLWCANLQEIVRACIPGAAPLAADMPIEEATLTEGLSRLTIAPFDELEHDPRMQDVAHRSLVTYVRWFCDESFASPPACMMSAKQLPLSIFKCLLQFRAGASWLNVNKGRSSQTPFNARLCLKCSSCQVEDAHHVVFECPVYDGIRERHACLFSLNGRLVHSGHCRYNSELMSLFMSQDGAQIGKFIYDCWKLRQTLEDQVPYFADACFDSFSSDED